MKIKNFKKGKAGEQKIIDEIQRETSKASYSKIIRNVKINKNDNSTEIDIILLTAFGIFVIESKNYGSYLVLGKEEDNKWKYYYRNKKYSQNYNPIIQNEIHIDFLMNYLNLSNYIFKSYIVFSNNVNISKLDVSQKEAKVINVKDLEKSLIDDMYKSDIVLSHEEIDKIYIKLKYYCNHLDDDIF